MMRVKYAQVQVSWWHIAYCARWHARLRYLRMMLLPGCKSNRSCGWLLMSEIVQCCSISQIKTFVLAQIPWVPGHRGHKWSNPKISRWLLKLQRQRISRRQWWGGEEEVEDQGELEAPGGETEHDPGGVQQVEWGVWQWVERHHWWH